MQRQTGTVLVNSRPLPIQFDSQTKDHVLVEARFLVKEKEKKIDPHARLMLAFGCGGGGGGEVS